MKQLTKDWLNAAEDDLSTAEILLTNPILTNIIAFHSQQAVEKSLKAIIEEFSISSIKTHNLQSLLIKIEKIIPFPVNDLIISELDRLYIDSRYPGDLGLMPHGKPSLEEAEMYYLEALEIKRQAEAFLSKQA